MDRMVDFDRNIGATDPTAPGQPGEARRLTHAEGVGVNLRTIRRAPTLAGIVDKAVPGAWAMRRCAI